MSLSVVQRTALLAILRGAYTPYDLREFVRLCHLIARPHISRKVGLRRLDLSLLGISEDDAVHDCLADVFRRDAGGRFSEIEAFFAREVGDAAGASDELLTVQLRRLVIGKVNNGLLRLYAEADPSLGKVLRNLKLALDGRAGVDQVTRFNETCLVPAGLDPVFHLPPFPIEELRAAASGVILVHDDIPSMLRKLRSILADQCAWQRAVPLVSAAIVFREIYTIGWNPAGEEAGADDVLESSRLGELVENVCREVREHVRRRYVARGKMDEVLLDAYCRTLNRILRSSFDDDGAAGATFYDVLREELGPLTRESYREGHKGTLEYIVKLGKQRLREQLDAG